MTEEYIDHVSDEVYEEILRYTSSSSANTERLLTVSLVALVKSGRASFEFIRDDGLRAKWSTMVKEASTRLTKRKAAMQKYEQVMSIISRLTPEEKKVLGLRTPTKPKN